MAYKIGFLYNFSSYLSDTNFIIATYDDGHFTFKRVSPSISLRNFRINSFSVNSAVVYKEAGDGTVSEIVFLDQIPVRS